MKVRTTTFTSRKCLFVKEDTDSVQVFLDSTAEPLELATPWELFSTYAPTRNLGYNFSYCPIFSKIFNNPVDWVYKKEPQSSPPSLNIISRPLPSISCDLLVPPPPHPTPSPPTIALFFLSFYVCVLSVVRFQLSLGLLALYLIGSAMGCIAYICGTGVLVLGRR